MSWLHHPRAHWSPDHWWREWEERARLQQAAEANRDGVAEMRDLLQCRCLGIMRACVSDTEAYRDFVTRTFGMAK